MFQLARDAVVLRKTSLRSTERDQWSGRRLFERALASVDWTLAGPSQNAVLLVRKLAPAVRLHPAGSSNAFASAVRTELTGNLHQARRPWIHGDAASAPAVLFLDEAELAACLVLDWLKGRVAERWWWRGVLGSLSVPEWLWRCVLVRGEILAAATDYLIESGDAISWYARIGSTEVSAARTALAAVYGISIGASEAFNDRPRKGSVVVGHRDVDFAPQTSQPSASLRTLFAIAPEVASGRLSVTQRELLAVALIVRRRLVWGRTLEFVQALSELSEHNDLGIRGQPLSRAASESPDAAIATGARAALDVQRSVSDDAGGRLATPQVVSAPGEPHEDTRLSLHSRVRGQLHSHNDDSEFASSSSEVDFRGRDPRDLATAAIPVGKLGALDAAGVETRFGGLFYLLNVALALGLYGDFTAPLARCLELSPWDLLALIGKRWFGREFRRDPVWGVLAQLANRRDSDFPGRDFHPESDWVWPEGESVTAVAAQGFQFRTSRRRRTPKEQWLTKVLTRVEPRIGLALQLADSQQVADTLCRHVAQIQVTTTRVDVRLSLAELPLTIRCAGLDRNLGWIPAAGRSVSFIFE